MLSKEYGNTLSRDNIGIIFPHSLLRTSKQCLDGECEPPGHGELRVGTVLSPLSSAALACPSPGKAEGLNNC